MSWYDIKQAAVDPDNPEANEQIPFSEWNAMVAYLKDKIVDKTVNTVAIGNDKVLVYKTATNTFVFEAQSTVGAINDLSDVTISGVPADNEVLAYDNGTSKWINQTAAEALLATTTQLTTLETAAVLEADFDATTFLYATADNTPLPKTRAETMAILSGTAAAEFLFNTQKIGGIVDPTTAQQASTKNYADTTLFTKEAVTAFTDGYVPVYRTASGKFEMEEQSAALGLPVADTTNIIKGSADGTKLVRFEADGLTTGTTRVMAVPDKDITICGIDDALLNPATKDMDMANNAIVGIFDHLTGYSQTSSIGIQGGTGQAAEVRVHGQNHAVYPGYIRLKTTNAAKTDLIDALRIAGVTDTPIVEILHGLDMNDKVIADMKNSAPTALSGTQKDIEIDIGGTPYYFTVYPTKA